MLDFTPILTAVASGAVGLIVWLVQEKRRAYALEAKQESVVEKAMIVLMRNQLISAHKVAIRTWTITTAELQSFREMHDLYVQMGGNGPASHLLEDLDRVKLVSD